MRKAFAIAIVILVAIVFLNDVGRWVNAQAALNEKTTELAQWAAENVGGGNVADNSRLVTAEGARLGVRVDQYTQTSEELQIWSSAEVPGTWVIGPYVLSLIHI